MKIMMRTSVKMKIHVIKGIHGGVISPGIGSLHAERKRIYQNKILCNGKLLDSRL